MAPQSSKDSLKNKLQKALGIVGFQLSDTEVIAITKRIQLIPKGSRNESAIQAIVTDITGYDTFMLNEALDMSDIDYLIAQIELALKNQQNR